MVARANQTQPLGLIAAAVIIEISNDIYGKTLSVEEKKDRIRLFIKNNFPILHSEDESKGKETIFGATNSGRLFALINSKNKSTGKNKNLSFCLFEYAEEKYCEMIEKKLDMLDEKERKDKKIEWNKYAFCKAVSESNVEEYTKDFVYNYKSPEYSEKGYAAASMLFSKRMEEINNHIDYEFGTTITFLAYVFSEKIEGDSKRRKVKAYYADLLEVDNPAHSEFFRETKERARYIHNYNKVSTERTSFLISEEKNRKFLNQATIDSLIKTNENKKISTLDQYCSATDALLSHSTELFRSLECYLNAGSLIRLVFDVECGAMIARKMSTVSDEWLVAITPIQSRVSAAENYIEEIAIALKGS